MNKKAPIRITIGFETASKCVVKIGISSETDYFHIEEVVYYRSGLTQDFVIRWLWYFEYLAALVKVNNPRRKVEFYKGYQIEEFPEYINRIKEYAVRNNDLTHNKH